MRTVAKVVVLIVVLVCLSAVPFLIFSRQPVSAQDRSTPRHISVSGNAEVRVVPDEVVLTVGIETWDGALQVGKDSNDERIRKIMALGKELSISPERMQTDYISIDPRYSDNYEKRNFIGFFVRRTVTITLRDLSKFDALLTGVLESGATHIHGVDFRTTELRKHRDQARALAIKAAREKAEALAGELGLKAGKPTNIQENQIWWWSSYRSWWGGYYNSGIQSQNVVQNAAPGGRAPSDSDSTVAPGQIAVYATVTVTFEME